MLRPRSTSSHVESSSSHSKDERFWVLASTFVACLRVRTLCIAVRAEVGGLHCSHKGDSDSFHFSSTLHNTPTETLGPKPYKT